MISRPMARWGAGIAACVALAGCVDLTVPNLNNPDRVRATATPGDVQNLIASTFLRWFNRIHNGTPTIAVGAMGYEFMTPFLCFSGQEVSLEPRPAWNNTTIYSRSGTSANPWLDYYSIISSTNDGLQALDRGLQIGPAGRDNDRARAFAKMMQGLGHGYLALLWDKAAIIDETTDLDTLVTPNYVPYDQVMAAAIEMLEESLAISTSSDFVLPSTGWIQGLSLTNEQLAQLTNTFMARLKAYVARSEQERAEAPWAEILAHIEAGFPADFAPIATPEVGESDYIRIAARVRRIRGDFMRPSNWLVGPADTSGAWQAWVATPVADRQPFQVVTADRRIHGAAGPASPGKYVEYEPTVFGNPTRGTHLRSYYYFKRYGTGTTYNTGPIVTISIEEMNLLKAEALIRLGRAAEAIPLINATRVAQGELPPVDINGPPDEPGCVPQKTDGRCGSLWDALRYEKRIEVMGTDGQVAFYDARGWNTLSQYSFLNFPIPGRELEIAGLPGYTHGGQGGTMAAPAPDWDGCPAGITLPRC